MAIWLQLRSAWKLLLSLALFSSRMVRHWNRNPGSARRPSSVRELGADGSTIWLDPIECPFRSLHDN